MGTHGPRGEAAWKFVAAGRRFAAAIDPARLAAMVCL